MNKKAVIGIIIAIAVVIIGIIIGVVIHNDNVAKKEAEEKAQLEAQQEQKVQEYNDKINNIVNPLLVIDANGENASIENNNDLDSMNNAITSLNTLKSEEIEKDTVITEEQKNTLITTIDGHIATITNRINAVNEANVEAQRQAEAESERQAQIAQANNSSSSSSNGKSSSSGSSASGSSGSSNSGYNHQEFIDTSNRITNYMIQQSSQESEEALIKQLYPDATNIRVSEAEGRIIYGE